MRLYEIHSNLMELVAPTSPQGTTSTQGTQAPPALKSGQTLKVDQQDAKQTTLIDPNTKVKTVVPNDPKKPGMIQKDLTGKAYLNTKPQGPVQQVKPGDTVTVK